MIGPDHNQLDRGRLDELCQQRKLSRVQCLHDDIIAKRNEIERNVNVLAEKAVELRPYGLPQEHWGAAEDVWQHILEHVTEPSSIKVLREVCPMFQTLLKAKYAASMLPEIVKLIAGKRPKYLQENIQDEFPLGSYFAGIEREKNLFFRLRRVSKQCKKSAENLWTFRVEIETIEKLDSIIEAVKKENFSVDNLAPFTFLVDDKASRRNDVGNAFAEMIVNFLGVVGRKIRTFEYDTRHNTAGEVYNHLREWAALMPNVEEITLYWMDDEDVVNVEENPGEIEQFPHSSSLRKYHEEYKSLPESYFRRMMEASPNITELDVRKTFVQVLDKVEKLTTLQICPDLAFLSHLRFPWKLNRLYLFNLRSFISVDGDIDTVSSFRTLFKFLEQFGETLQHLRVRIDVEDSAGEYLRLPNLKTLKWQQHTSLRNINFLLYAEKLEYLQVKMAERLSQSSPAMQYERIIGAESGSFLGKSVWEVFPYLKCVRVVRTNLYELGDRECFEQYRP